MRALTPAEQARLAELRERFDAFVGERMDVICDLFDALGASVPALAVAEPEQHLDFLDRWLAAQDLSAAGPDDRVWLATRLMYFVGEVLIARHGGCWAIDEDPERPTFLRFVVGSFADGAGSVVDPRQVAWTFCQGTEGRSLRVVVDELSASIRGQPHSDAH